jgi:anaphase-promoting complex subunit 3
MESFEKAMQSFRNAIRLDPRHYNAWYGIGSIYLRQEKWDFATSHFKKAVSINPKSCVLWCYVGIAFQASKRYRDALSALERAVKLDEQHTLVRYKKASVLVSMKMYKVRFGNTIDFFF